MKVTVFMPVYNGEKYLREAIESVLNQSYQDFEFIILNDGSKDDSQNIIRSYLDKRIHLVENLFPSGLMAVRNQGLQIATGEYFAPIDCDDVWERSRLEKQVTFLEKNPQFAFIGSRASFINEMGELKGVSWRYKFSPQTIPPFLLFGNYFIHSSILMRRSMIPKEGYQATTAEDYDLWIRMSRLGLIWSLPDLLVKYRVHTAGDTYRQSILTNRTQQQVRIIYLNQLKYLGLEPTPKELDLHCAIGSRNLSSLQQLHESGKWLKKIIIANRNTYNQAALLHVIIERWLILCVLFLQSN